MIKLRILQAFAILLASSVVAVIIYFTFRKVPEARVTIGVTAIDGYEEPTEAAMDVWNAFVGCKFFVAGDDVLVKSDDGTPCGDPWRPENEWGHAATAYRCSATKSEILISSPGNSNTQACILAHELGHTLKEFGVVHADVGVMGKCSDPLDGHDFLYIRDRDKKAIREAFCK